MLSDTDLTLIIAAGEDDKIERKRSVNLSDKAAKAEFVLDILSLVNAHGPRPAYLLIGVQNNGDLFDVSDQGHDDAKFQQILSSYIEPPVRFSYRQQSIQGVMIGVIEITPSQTRFHVVAKDLSEGPKKFLEKGDTRIKRGSSKQRPGAWDYALLREEASQQALPQPKLSVTFLGEEAETEVEISRQPKHVVGTDWMGLAGISDQFYLPGTGAVSFDVTNEGSSQADNIHVFITLPDECVLQRKIEPPGIAGVTARINNVDPSADTSVYPLQREIRLSFNRIVHGLSRTSEECYIAFPRIGEAFELKWTAHAGNMILEMSGSLIINTV